MVRLTTLAVRELRDCARILSSANFILQQVFGGDDGKNRVTFYLTVFGMTERGNDSEEEKIQPENEKFFGYPDIAGGLGDGTEMVIAIGAVRKDESTLDEE